MIQEAQHYQTEHKKFLEKAKAMNDLDQRCFKEVPTQSFPN